MQEGIVLETGSIVNVRSTSIMKRYHKGIIIIGALIIILMLLFPPFHVIYQPGIEIDKGYAFILNPPIFWGQIKSTVNISRLMIQVTGSALLCAAVYILVRAYTK